jgi:hypothetical protein
MQPTWGDLLSAYFLDAAKILTPIIMSIFTVWLHKFLARYHMTLFEGMIERHASEIVMAETNEAAITAQEVGGKIRWAGVIACSVKKLLAAHSTLTEERAQSIANAVMLKIDGVGPVDLGTLSGEPNARTLGLGPVQSTQAAESPASQGPLGGDSGLGGGSGAAGINSGT